MDIIDSSFLIVISIIGIAEIKACRQNCKK